MTVAETSRSTYARGVKWAPSFPRSLGRKGSHEQRAEDGGLDLRPNSGRRVLQKRDLARSEFEHSGVFKQVAVEAFYRSPDRQGILAFVHASPKVGEQWSKRSGSIDVNPEEVS